MGHSINNNINTVPQKYCLDGRQLLKMLDNEDQNYI